MLLRLDRFSIGRASISIAASSLRIRDSARASGLGNRGLLSNLLPRSTSLPLPLSMTLDPSNEEASSSSSVNWQLLMGELLVERFLTSFEGE